MTEPAIIGIRTFEGTDLSGPGHYLQPNGALQVGARYKVVTTHEGTLGALTPAPDGRISFRLDRPGDSLRGYINVEAQKWELLAPAVEWTAGDLAIAESPSDPIGRRCLVRYTADGRWLNLFNGITLGDAAEWTIIPLDEFVEIHA